MELNGTALVIGASGIGGACARALARNGIQRLVVSDLDHEAAENVITECERLAKCQNFKGIAVRIDVTTESSVAGATKAAHEFLKRIDYCINSAGIGVNLAYETSEANVEEFDKMIDVHVRGSFLILRSISAIMKEQLPYSVDPSSPARGTTRGSIVMVGSASAFAATPRMIQYTGAKHAVAGLVKNAALDNAAYGVRVNSVCPSWVDTPMTRKAIKDVEGLDGMIKAMVPLGRIATSEEVADVVMFLCSPLSRYVQSFPAPGLRQIFRHITGLNEKGESIFLGSDHGDHHRIMGEQQAVANILYSTQETPVELNGNADIEKARAQEPPLHYHNGSIVRMIDFAPGVESPMHRAVSIDYGVVLDGVFELVLDSGEKRIMRQGDVSINRAAAHQWRNITGNGTMPGRMMWILLDVKDVYVDGKKVEGFLGDLAKEYVDQGVAK
ncbi:NAD(P)-binding protein [Nemania abortiva]|nr:NAD(P)-binding protein [Nemania abortiva]